MEIDLHMLLSVMGASQGFILAIFLFLNKRIKEAGKILAIFTIVFSLGLLEGLIAPLSEQAFLSWIQDYVGICSYLFGPLLYFYIFKSLKPSQKLAFHKHLLLFYIFVVVLFLNEIYYGIFNFKFNSKENIIFEIATFELLFLQLFLYAYWCVVLLNKYRKDTKSAYLNWLWYLTISLTVIYLISFVSTNLMLLGLNFENILLSFVQVGSVIVVYSFSYHALLQKEVLPITLYNTPKYSSSAIDEDNKEVYLKKIIDIMEEEKLYLDPLLTLDKFASLLGINRFYISQVINEKLGKNFPDFVNAYRIEKTKSLLASEKGKQYTLLAVAYESGFNSKTSFNTVFKKYTGLTPSAFRKAQLLNTPEK